MREILFKAKRLDNGKWVEGYYQKRKDYDEQDEHLIFRCVSYHSWEYAKVDPRTICQYTGLTDKNGNKIWENDILSYSYDYPDSPWLKADGKTNKDIVYKKGQVFWQGWRGTWAVTSRLGKKGGNQDVFVYCRNPNRTEVIGNIFDNAELLEGCE